MSVEFLNLYVQACVYGHPSLQLLLTSQIDALSEDLVYISGCLQIDFL